MVARRSCRGRWRARAVLAAALLAALAAACVRAPAAELRTRAAFPRHRPAALAHLLADFSTHPHAGGGAWAVREESGNYSSWHYRVSFSCGARCAGEALVRAASEPPAAHGAARAHSVRAWLRTCARAPLLPWPELCDEMEIEWEVRGAGEGCAVEERARATCGALRVLSGACAGALAARTRDHLAALRGRLHAAAAAVR